MSKQTISSHSGSFASTPVTAMLLGALALSTQAYGATSNVDIYGILHIVVSNVDEYAATLAESGGSSAQAGRGWPDLPCTVPITAPYLIPALS